MEEGKGNEMAEGRTRRDNTEMDKRFQIISRMRRWKGLNYGNDIVMEYLKI